MPARRLPPPPAFAVLQLALCAVLSRAAPAITPDGSGLTPGNGSGSAAAPPCGGQGQQQPDGCKCNSGFLGDECQFNMSDTTGARGWCYGGGKGRLDGTCMCDPDRRGVRCEAMEKCSFNGEVVDGPEGRECRCVHSEPTRAIMNMVIIQLLANCVHPRTSPPCSVASRR